MSNLGILVKCLELDGMESGTKSPYITKVSRVFRPFNDAIAPYCAVDPRV